MCDVSYFWKGRIGGLSVYTTFGVQIPPHIQMVLYINWLDSDPDKIEVSGSSPLKTTKLKPDVAQLVGAGLL